MTRQSLQQSMPRWIEIEHWSPQRKAQAVAAFLGLILAELEASASEPFPWEAHHLAYALEALVAGRFYAALTFSETALASPDERTPNSAILGATTVRREHLRAALNLVQARIEKA
ncbi:MAG: hypothetical protein ABI702_16935 [Burkholderiales bacterium]